MSSPTPLIALGLLLAGFCHAEELAIEAKPFEVVHKLETKAMPAGEVELVKVDAKAWSSFSIIQLADHGTAVKKGDVLVAFDAREIDKQIDGLKRQLGNHELAIAEAGDKLTRLKETAERRLEAAKRDAEHSQERLDYFAKSGRKAEEEEALHTIKRNQQWLANEKEELRQLKQMYEADDLTEDTEEIILTRQQNAVENAELMLRLAKLRQTRELEVLLPRKATALQEAATEAAVALSYAERAIPREIEQTEAALKALKVTAEQDTTRLADLEHDRQFFEIKAKVAGTFYHGAIADGNWVTGDLLRGLRVGGSAPTLSAFGSLVPAGAKLELVAHTNATVARQLTVGSEGSATIAGTQTGSADINSIAVKLTGRSLVPSTQGKYQVSLTPEWPKGLLVEVGNPATAHLLVHSNPEAIVVPEKALKYGLKGWSVELKLADGKTERRPVARGAQSGDQVEILSGLEVGQVIITP